MWVTSDEQIGSAFIFTDEQENKEKMIVRKINEIIDYLNDIKSNIDK